MDKGYASVLGRHINHGQRRWIVGIGAAAVVALIAWIVWPSGASQTPPVHPQNPSGDTQTSVPSIGASPVTTTTNTLPKSTTDSSIVDNGQGKIVAFSPAPSVAIQPTATTVPDTTSGVQGWGYVVSASPGGGGVANDPTAFTCLLVENYPKVGEYGGCGFSGPIVVIPQDGDVLTETATFASSPDWSGSTSAQVTYAMP